MVAGNSESQRSTYTTLAVHVDRTLRRRKRGDGGVVSLLYAKVSPIPRRRLTRASHWTAAPTRPPARRRAPPHTALARGDIHEHLLDILTCSPTTHNLIIGARADTPISLVNLGGYLHFLYFLPSFLAVTTPELPRKEGCFFSWACYAVVVLGKPRRPSSRFLGFMLRRIAEP